MIGRAELEFQIRSFIEDGRRGIPVRQFAKLAGINERMFRDIFVYRNTPLTAEMQIRIGAAWDRWCSGVVKVEYLGDTERTRITLRDPLDAKPRFRRLMAVSARHGLKLGIVPRYDYHAQRGNALTGKES